MAVAVTATTYPPFRLETQDGLYPKGGKARAAANADALQVLATLDVDDGFRHLAHPADKEIISRFSGWGSQRPLFNGDPDWDSVRSRLREHLDDQAWDVARRSTLDSFYTDVDVAREIWRLLTGLGVTSHPDGSPVRALEPCVGSGVVLSTAPLDLNVEWHCLDIDPTACRVTQALHPKAVVRCAGFETAPWPDETFDLVFSNLPYVKGRIHDPRHNPGRWMVHYHFLAKAIALCRPGGYVAVLNSAFYLNSDKAHPRALVDQVADLVCVVRFPTGMFAQAAGTNVVEDLLVFRRRPVGELHLAERSAMAGLPAGPTWLSSENRSGLGVSWRSNVGLTDLSKPPAAGLPYMVALGLEGAERRGTTRSEFVVTLTAGDDEGGPRGRALGFLADVVVPQVIERAAPLVPYVPPAPDTAGDTDWKSRWDDELSDRKPGSIHLTGKGSLVRIVDGGEQPYKPARSTDTAELKALVRLRDLTLRTLGAMVAGEPYEAHQRALGDAYDRYIATPWPGSPAPAYLNRFRETVKFVTDEETGEVTTDIKRSRPSMGGFSRDPDYFAVLALEQWDEATRSARKAAIFTENVVGTPADARPETVSDALAVSLNETAEVDIDLMGRLLDRPAWQIEDDLRAAGAPAFENPSTGQWEPAASYLAGDVRTALDIARQASTTDRARWARNITALEAVVPEWLGPEEIDLRLGSPLVDPDDVAAFAAQHFGARPMVEHIPAIGAWTIDVDREARGYVTAVAEWGTPSADAFSLLERALEQKPAEVYDSTPRPGRKPIKVLNRAETEAAQAKLESIGDRFADWVWEDNERADRYVDLYNRKVNCWAPPVYDGSHLTLAGLAPQWTMRPHQLDAIWRAICEGGMVLAHSVGLGKTAVIIATCVELRRLGIAGKPLVVIPNHMLEQIAREARQLYPAARMLVCSAEDASAKGRRQFAARCATGNWDMVIMTHSAFGLIPLSDEAKTRHVAHRCATLRRAMAESGGDVAKIETLILNLTARLKESMAGGDEDGLTFEQLGCDWLAVDEAHLFKNITTGSSVVQTSTSKRADALAAKIDWLHDRYAIGRMGRRRRRVVLSTGTPVANSIAELWSMSRLADYQRLIDAGYGMFDAWFGAFGQIVSRLEVTPDGGGFKAKQRPDRFRNVPELIAQWRQVADTKTLKTVAGIDVPTVVGGKRRAIVSQPSTGHRRFVAELMVRAADFEEGFPQWRPKIIVDKDTGVREWGSKKDQMLWIGGDGMRASLDLRLTGNHPDPTGGKIGSCAAEVARIYKATNGRDYGTGVAGSLQLVFCDLGVNPADRCLDCGYPLGQGPRDVCRPCAEFATTEAMSVYERLRVEIARRGVPFNRVRFMSDATDDQAKARLFAEARDGLVSVLVGSTERMGVGTNVQHRCVAIHHLDAPWRPCDIEQREGRGIRQGNWNTEIEILVYVVEGTFDAFKWQRLQAKAGFIEQILAGLVTSRTIDDVGETAMSFAEIKAAASGNPAIAELAQAELDLKGIRAKRASWLREVNHLGSMLDDLSIQRKDLRDQLVKARTAAASVEKWRQIHAHPADKPLVLTAQRPHADARGGLLPDPQDRLVAWVNWWRDDRDTGGRHWKQAWPLGSLGPFTLKLRPLRQYLADEQDPEAAVGVEIGTPVPIVAELDQRALKLPGDVDWDAWLRERVEDPAVQVARLEVDLDRVETQIATCHAGMERPFPLADRLEAVEGRVAELEAEMRKLTDLQVPDPSAYDENPPDDVDWAQLEKDLAAQAPELVQAFAQTVEEAQGDDGWEDPWGITDDGQGLLFTTMGAPARRRRRR